MVYVIGRIWQWHEPDYLRRTWVLPVLRLIHWPSTNTASKSRVCLHLCLKRCCISGREPGKFVILDPSTVNCILFSRLCENEVACLEETPIPREQGIET